MKVFGGLTVLIVFAYAVVLLTLRTKIGPGQANELVQEWQEKRPGIDDRSDLELTCGETGDEVQIQRSLKSCCPATALPAASML